MKKAYCDLHTHSYYSDGTSSPQEIVELAKEKELSAVALCDHNTVSGIREFLSAARDTDVEAVAGIEFSTDYNGIELHLLGLFLPLDSLDKIEELCAESQRRKEKSNEKMIKALNEAGYEIDHDKIKRQAMGKINRAHVASYLTDKGYTASVDEAFKTVLSEKRGFYQPPKRPSTFEMIDFIRSINAVSVLAHPFLNLDERSLREFLRKAKKHGLCGMEVEYSKYEEETAALSRKIAEKHGLKMSGGSDFHGTRKPDISLGTGRGDLKVPTEFFAELKKISCKQS